MALDYRRQLAVAYHRVQAVTAASSVESVRKAWKRMRATDIDGSWRAVRDDVTVAVVRGQARAAATSELYLQRLLAADDLVPEATERLSPASFVGWTADGAQIQDLLDYTPTFAKVQIAEGRSPADALAAAERRLALITGSEVQDAGRGAMDAGMRLEDQIVGYERYVNAPCCSRCLVLAGRFYRKSEGFLRHPRCDCCHRPVTAAGRAAKGDQDPLELFHEMTDEQQDVAFTRDGARAIRDGANISQVVNARWQGGVRGKSAGMSRPGDPYTTSGTSKRSLYARQERAAGRKVPRRRLSPQGIALEAGADSVRYRQLLRDNGYLL